MVALPCRSTVVGTLPWFVRMAATVSGSFVSMRTALGSSERSIFWMDETMYSTDAESSAVVGSTARLPEGAGLHTLAETVNRSPSSVGAVTLRLGAHTSPGVRFLENSLRTGSEFSTAKSTSTRASAGLAPVFITIVETLNTDPGTTRGHGSRGPTRRLGPSKPHTLRSCESAGVRTSKLSMDQPLGACASAMGACDAKTKPIQMVRPA